jgi:hypothetical protein
MTNKKKLAIVTTIFILIVTTSAWWYLFHYNWKLGIAIFIITTLSNPNNAQKLYNKIYFK